MKNLSGYKIKRSASSDSKHISISDDLFQRLALSANPLKSSVTSTAFINSIFTTTGNNTASYFNIPYSASNLFASKISIPTLAFTPPAFAGTKNLCAGSLPANARIKTAHSGSLPAPTGIENAYAGSLPAHAVLKNTHNGSLLAQAGIAPANAGGANAEFGNENSFKNLL